MSKERRIFLNDQRSLAQIRRREMQQILEDDVSSDEEESKKRLASYPPISHDEATIIADELQTGDPNTCSLERLEYCVRHLRYWINMQDKYTLHLASNDNVVHAIIAYLELSYAHYKAALQSGGNTDLLLTVIYETSWLLSSLSYYSSTAERMLYQKYEVLLGILSDLKHTPASETLCIIILNITSSKQIRLTPLECATILRFFYKHLLTEYPDMFYQSQVVKQTQTPQDKLEISFISRYAMYIIGNLVYAMISYYETQFPLSYLQAGTDDDYHEFDFTDEGDVLSTCYFEGRLHHPYFCPTFIAELARVSGGDEVQIEEDFISQSFAQQTIFIFRAFSHIFELGVSIFMLIPPANGSFINRILYMLVALLEVHVTSCWSCNELAMAYNVAFVDKLFSLVTLRKKNLTSLTISTINKIIQSRSSYEELQLKERVVATCEDSFISTQVPSISSLLAGTSIYDIGGPLDAPSLPPLIEKIFMQLTPLSANFNIQISSHISSLLGYIVNHFLEAIYPNEHLFNQYIRITKGMPITKVSAALHSLIELLTFRDNTHLPDTWKNIYDMLIYFCRFGNAKKKTKDILIGFVTKLLETYPDTTEFFLAVGGEDFIVDNLDQPLFEKLAADLEILS